MALTSTKGVSGGNEAGGGKPDIRPPLGQVDATELPESAQALMVSMELMAGGGL